ncbi:MULTISPECIES: type II toxin-antitoxin system RelE/ParE family toxin [unclassified Sphingomonas]|jgi:mRNA interferase RelE/StbE|uniref:type II toxin-antitoxin system RelE family toxin n=1 Tax=unclassified Sphingomonas TaxID=196159 RepID=UPI0010F47268|nr:MULTISPECIES: type II toxin-antitoxin system RelE/ParE family toxin [unclassified Sphingomonas]
MAFTVQFTKAALKAIKRMPATDATRVREKIDQYAAAPESLANNVTKLTGSDYIRLRVGDYRVIMLPDGTILLIVAVGPRGSIYD